MSCLGTDLGRMWFSTLVPHEISCQNERNAPRCEQVCVTNCSRLALTLMSATHKTSVRTWPTVVEYSFEQTAIDGVIRQHAGVAGMTTKLLRSIFELGESINHCSVQPRVTATVAMPRLSTHQLLTPVPRRSTTAQATRQGYKTVSQLWPARRRFSTPRPPDRPLRQRKTPCRLPPSLGQAGNKADDSPRSWPRRIANKRPNRQASSAGPQRQLFRLKGRRLGRTRTASGGGDLAVLSLQHMTPAATHRWSPEVQASFRKLHKKLRKVNKTFKSQFPSLHF